MKCNPNTQSTPSHLLALALTACLALPLPSLAASVALATSPLATSTPSTVLPNVMFILDDSGSMDWNYMPDVADNFNGKYGFASNQCNGVYYDPSITYNPPVYADGTNYSNASFTAAWTDGYNTAGGTTNLSTGFRPTSSYTTGSAFYYAYSGTQASSDKKDYYNQNSIFYRECNSAIGSSTAIDGTNPVNTVFTKRRLNTTETTKIEISGNNSTSVSSITVGSSGNLLNAAVAATTSSSTMATNIASEIHAKTATTGYDASAGGSTVTVTGPTSAANLTPVITQSGSMTLTPDVFPDTTAANLTNFANWYSYYRTRMLMMKTASGRAFKSLDQHYRVGFMTINNNVSPDILNITTFDATQKSNWYAKLYAATPDNSTPLREALSNAGKIYAHKLTSLYSLTLTDPVQYSCQQNFTILSTDGFWNGNDGSKLNGNAIGNQDGLVPRPKYDGVFIDVTSTQVRETKTQVAKATSRVEKRTKQEQKQISQLQTRTSTLQTRTGSSTSNPLQRRDSTNSGATYGAWYDVSTAGCTVDNSGTNRNQCQGVEQRRDSTNSGATYGAWYDVSTTGCTVDNSGTNRNQCQAGTTTTWSSWTNAATTCTSSSTTECQYISTAWVGTSSCTAAPPSPASPYTVLTATECQTAVTSAYANATCGAGDVTTVPDASGYTTQCQTTDTGFVAASSCTPSGPTAGQTVTCNTITTGGPTNYVVPPCTAPAPAAGNNWTTTTCTTTTLQTATLVASCTPGNSGNPNYIQTTCTPTSTTLTNQTSCPAEPASAGNDWTTVTCVATTGGTSDTLADVAMYYYQTDLRNSSLSNCIGAAGVDVCNNNVFKTDTDTNTAQHMATFTLGLGASSRMKYSPSYLSDTSGDYYSVLKGLTADSSATPPICSWQSNGTICNWPVPGDNLMENIDDLWHAAVDGQGVYFSASNPSSLSSGLTNALAAISARKGAGAAAATSTMNPVPGNNFAYVASYTTVKWQGNLEARTVDPTTLKMSKSAYWCVENIVPDTCAAPATIEADTSVTPTAYSCVTANSTDATCTTPGEFYSVTSKCKVPMATSCTGTMPARVATNSDTRTIWTANDTHNGLIHFGGIYNPTYGSAGDHPANFEAAHINGLSQWTSLTAAQKNAAEGVSLVNFLRGQTDHEDRLINQGADDNRLFRYRESTLGDALESQPVFIANPVFPYVDPGYADFAAAQASRPGTVYIGTNDGMLHAFAASDGSERWAYVPSMVIPNMWKLADKDYSARHTNFVNGSPIVSDVCTANCGDSTLAVWRTILVGGLNAGGRGYYALDITNPASPSLLWEFTTAEDSDLGYTYGNPVITAKSDGTWVVLVTSGYNNTSPGNGQGYLYVLNAGSGQVISKIGNGAGSTTTPSGLAKISGWNNSASSNRATFVYGGDLLGNVWRFDINTPTDAPVLFATLKDPSDNPQPITTAPVLGEINFKRVVFITTGKYLETWDLTNTSVQSVYALKDDNSTYTNPAGSPRNSLTLVQQTITPIAGTSQRTSTKNTVNFNSGGGWYSDFPDAGERSNIESRLVEGTLVVATIVPSNTVCAPGGYSWLNFFDYLTGGPVDSIVSERYDNPIVGINYFVNSDGTSISIVDSSGNNLLDPHVIDPPPPPKFNGIRVLWRELNP